MDNNKSLVPNENAQESNQDDKIDEKVEPDENIKPGVERKSVREEGAKCSGKVSDIARYLAYGIIATCFTLLTSTAPFAKEIVKQHMVQLVVSAVLGCLAAACDMLQYNFGYWVSKNTINKGQQSDGSFIYVHDWRYYGRQISYRAKLLLVFLGSLGLVTSMLIYIYNNHSGISGHKKPNRSQKILQIEIRKIGENWLPISAIGLTHAYSENSNAKGANFSNELVPSIVEDKLVVFNRIKAICEGKIIAEINLDDTNMDSPMGFVLQCNGASYRATLIDKKDVRYPPTLDAPVLVKTLKKEKAKRLDMPVRCNCFDALSSAQKCKYNH